MSSKSNSIYKLIRIQSQRILESSNCRQLWYIYSLEEAQGRKQDYSTECVFRYQFTKDKSRCTEEQRRLVKQSQLTSRPQSQFIDSHTVCVWFCSVKAFQKYQYSIPESPVDQASGGPLTCSSWSCHHWFPAMICRTTSLFSAHWNALWRAWIVVGVRVLSPSLPWDWWY